MNKILPITIFVLATIFIISCQSRRTTSSVSIDETSKSEIPAENPDDMTTMPEK
jgi:hypothetical protein